MATLATQRAVLAGLTASYTAAAASQKFRPGPKVFLHIKNTDSTPHNVTLNDPTSVSPPNANQFDPDVVVAIPNGGDKFIVTSARFADPADSGLASLTWASFTGMSIAVLSL